MTEGWEFSYTLSLAGARLVQLNYECLFGKWNFIHVIGGHLMKKLVAIISAFWLLCCSPLALAGVVNINTADAQSLADNITGVGLKRAQAIVAYREAHGPFASVDALTQVKGIGEGLLEKNRENIVVKEPEPAE